MSDGRSTEDALVRRIRELTARTTGAGVRVGIGDDCAVLRDAPGDPLLATTDLLIEDVHFRRRWAEPADLGWKALAVNLSDIAAMGGRPRWALVAFAGTEGTTAEEIEAFYAGALELASAHDTVIVGGDTSSSPVRLDDQRHPARRGDGAAAALDRSPRRHARRHRHSRSIGGRAGDARARARAGRCRAGGTWPP